MPFEVTKFAEMYIANKTTIHSALGLGKVISVCFAQLTMGRRHSGIFVIFRWFKFTLKPPYSGAHERSLLAIWDTSHWNFFVKFGLRTA